MAEQVTVLLDELAHIHAVVDAFAKCYRSAQSVKPMKNSKRWLMAHGLALGLSPREVALLTAALDLDLRKEATDEKG